MKTKSGSNDLAPYYFHQGTSDSAYRYLGCQAAPAPCGQGWIYTFRTWAPNARSVSVVGDFCDWSEGLAMRRVTDGGVWEGTVTAGETLEGKPYKFRIQTPTGDWKLKGDPYARFSRGGSDGASLICHPTSFVWHDDAWMAHRKRTVCADARGHYLSAPLNIYEVHLPSFDREEDGSYLTYRKLAEILGPYVKRMGYTHVELLPVTEYPYDGSWGYQVCGYFAPTSRLGTPDDFRYFVDRLHSMGVGVLMDWVPAHFPKDEWGLFEFDGTRLYEYQGIDRMESRSWGTRFFDLGREEVQSFLVSSAHFWLEEYHIDGLRVDAVASMLYLDYDRLPGEWIPGPDGDNKNREAIAFLRKLNSTLFGIYPDILMIAEESTSFAKITHPVSEGGLGFNLKWNMGWANDFFDYAALDPLYRRYHHKALTFPLMYAFGENYVLPVSHDEVVHGKKSFLDKFFGTNEEKFLQVRTAFLLMMTYPGKKMLFMGTEYGQYAEWDYKRGLEWFMTDYPLHGALREYVAALNAFYLSEPTLWSLDFSPEGFVWINADEADRNLVAFRRFDGRGGEVVVALSFGGSAVTDLCLPTAPGRDLVLAFESSPGCVISSAPAGGGAGLCVSLAPFGGAIWKVTDRRGKPIPLPDRDTPVSLK